MRQYFLGSWDLGSRLASDAGGSAGICVTMGWDVFKHTRNHDALIPNPTTAKLIERHRDPFLCIFSPRLDNEDEMRCTLSPPQGAHLILLVTHR